MGTAESVIAQIDQIIEYFNKRRMDLPDGFFDRKTQFLINGATFESLLSATPNDPLVLMLARGPAGYRFTIKALQHAIPDVKAERGDVSADGDPSQLRFKVRLLGKLRDTGEAINSVVAITLRLTSAGLIETASAEIDRDDVERIRRARVSA